MLPFYDEFQVLDISERIASKFLEVQKLLILFFLLLLLSFSKSSICDYSLLALAVKVPSALDLPFSKSGPTSLTKMAFVRARLSKVFRVNDDQQTVQSDTTPEKQRQPSAAASVADSGYYSNATSRSRSPMKPPRPTTPLRDHGDVEDTRAETSDSPSKSLRSTYSPNKRPIHKLASTTIKMFSDTIRSKATMFYVSPIQTEIPRSDDTDSPTKRDRAARLLSSLRSRDSRNFKDDPQTEEMEVEPRVYMDMPHELDVEIPNSSLIDHTTKAARQNSISFLGTDVRIPTAYDQARWKKGDKLPHPFGDTLVEENSTIGVTEKAPSLIDLVRDSPGTSSAINKSQITPTTIVEISAPVEGVDHMSDTGSDRHIVKITEESAMRSAMGSSPATPQSQKSSTRGSLFARGRREQERLHLSSQYGRGLLCHSAVKADNEAQHSNPDLTAKAAIDSGELFVMSSLPADGDITVTRGREPAQSTDVDHIDAEDQPELDRPLSVSSNLDAEERTKCLDLQTVDTPSMGPKSEWDKVRAERQRRYHKVSGTSTASKHGIEERSNSHLESCRDRLSVDVQTDKNMGTAEDDASTTGDLTRSRKVRFEESPDLQQKKLELSSNIELGLRPLSVSDEYHTTNTRRSVPDTNKCADMSATQKVEEECSSIWHESESGGYAVDVVDYTRSSVSDNVDLRSLSSASTLQDVIEATDSFSHLGSISPEIASSRPYPRPRPRDLLDIEPLHVRKASSHSASTTDSCAVTTKGEFRYDAERIPSLHVRTSPVRRTSSINAELNSALDMHDDGDFSPSIPPPKPAEPTLSMGAAASDALELPDDTVATTAEGSNEGDHECWLKLMVEVKPNAGEDRKSQVLRRSLKTRRTGNDLTTRSASELNVNTTMRPNDPKISSSLGTSQAMSTPVRPHNTQSENLSPVRFNKESSVRKSCLPKLRYEQSPYNIEDLPPLPDSVDTPYHTSGEIIGLSKESSVRKSCLPMSHKEQNPYNIEDFPPLPASVDTPYHTSGENIGLSHLCSSFSPSPIENTAASGEFMTELRLEQKRTHIMSTLPVKPKVEYDLSLAVRALGQEEINSGSGVLDCSPGTRLRRTRRVKRGGASKSPRNLGPRRAMDERMFDDQDMERDFIAARLPNLESARSTARTTRLHQMAVSTLNFLGSIESEATSSLASSINDCNSADASFESTSSGQRRGYGKNRSLMMKDSSFSGEKFTYDAVGAPKPGFQTSSQKKGVWWDREFQGLNVEESPLACKSTIEAPLQGKESINNVPTYCQTQTEKINDKDGVLLAEDKRRHFGGDTERGEVNAHHPDGRPAKCSMPEPFSTIQSAQEEPTTPTNDQVSLPRLFPLPHFKTLKLTPPLMEQGQDTNQPGEFITPSFWFEAPLQEVTTQAAMEPSQEQEMVSRSEVKWVVGAFHLPRASPSNASVRYLSGGSWTSLDCKD